MRKLFAVTAAFALLGLGVATSAAITIDTVRVGDAGNTADSTGYGAVSYDYNIGKYEVTAGQYCAFLNAVAKTDTYGLYNSSMWSSSYGCKIQRIGTTGNYSYSVASDWANRPVNYVSFWDSCRFANWLSNGQKSGAQDATTTEDGAYTLNGYNWHDDRAIQRNANWTWAVTNEDEWYKAAYYKGGGSNAGHWLYPTQSNTAPSNQLIDPDLGNNATYYINGYAIGSPYFRTEVGAHENSDSAYGTFDQGGNVSEWSEGIRYSDYSYRCRRGGSFVAHFVHFDKELRADNFTLTLCTQETEDLGFRVSQAIVPEPSSIMALLGGLTGLIWLRIRKA